MKYNELTENARRVAGLFRDLLNIEGELVRLRLSEMEDHEDRENAILEESFLCGEIAETFSPVYEYLKDEFNASSEYKFNSARDLEEWVRESVRDGEEGLC